MSELKASKRKTEPKGKKSKTKEVASPRKKPNKRTSANIEQLLVEENDKTNSDKTFKTSATHSGGDIIPLDENKTKKETEEEFRKFQEDLSKKAQAKREENEKKNKKSNGTKSPRKKKIEEKEPEREKIPLSDSCSETQDSLASIMSTLEKDKEPVVSTLLKKLIKFLKDPTFTKDFIRVDGFDKLATLLVKLNDKESLLAILSFLQMAFHDYQGVFEQVFTKSSVMVTTLVWLLVKKSEIPEVTAKVYLLLSSLPTIAQLKKFPELEIHSLIFSALNLYHQKSEEKLRFKNLIKSLQANSKELKLATIKLINAVIEMYQSVEGRIGIRLEFISLDFENYIKLNDEDKPEIRLEISRYENLRDKDIEQYKQLHEKLMSPNWIQGKDLETLGKFLTTRWASLPNQQSVVVATLSSLLHIPNDEVVGTSKWLFLNKVVNQVVSNVQLNLGYDNIDVKSLIQAFTVEVSTKKELEDEKRHTQYQAEKIRSLEARLITEKALSSELEILRNNLAETTEKLSKMEIKLNSEKENSNQLQINYSELKNNFETLEKQDQDNLTTIKSLQQKLEEHEKTQQSKRTSSFEDHTSTTVTSIVYSEPSNIVPIQLSSKNSPPKENSSGIDLDKEELRINRAMSKFGGNIPQTSSWVRNPVSPRTDQDGLISPNGTNALSQKAPSRVTSPRLSDTSDIPDWKKKQLEKERLDKEKLEREQQRKLENLSSTIFTLTPPTTGTLTTPEVINPVEVTIDIDDIIVKPTLELTQEEREEIRLAKTLNRPRGRTSQVHT